MHKTQYVWIWNAGSKPYDGVCEIDSCYRVSGLVG